MTKMKRVLVLNGYYLPAKNYGGPTTSLANIVRECGDDFDFRIIAADHDLNDSQRFEGIQPGWNQVGKAKVKYVNLEAYRRNAKEIERIIAETNPDLVWLVGILTPQHWFEAKACRKLGIPYLISPRGEVCSNAFHSKYPKKLAAATLARLLGFYRHARFHATSDDERMGLIRYYGADPSSIFLVANIPATLKAIERRISKKSGVLRLVYISRIQDTKNLLMALRALSLVDNDVTLDIFGPIENEEYWNQCTSLILECNRTQQNRVNYCGQLQPEEVVTTFANYHAFLFPTKTENYGHTISESLSSSCPVIIPRGTTPWDDVDGVGGYTCTLDCVEDYVAAIKRISAMSQEEYDGLVETTRLYYNRKMDENDSVALHKAMLLKAVGESC